VAEEGDVLLGYARLGRHMPIEANAHVLHLDALAVSPAARGRRVGSALLDAAVAEARRRGARKLGLRALSTNGHAIALYLRHGFAEEGRLRDEIRLPGGSYADDVWMALALI
jgi:ribosomal protein S18 acetylase RimI-like enzyme